MDIYSRLKEDHDHQRALFEKLSNTEGKSEERTELWKKTKVELEAHASAEEQTFYAELMSKPGGSDMARHSVAEHKETADLISELEEIDMSSSAWLQKLKHLQERTVHHLDEEEKEVFPAAKKLIAQESADSLADEFNDRKPAEKKKEQAA